MRVHKVIDPVTGQTSWTVVGPDHLPVDPVESFLVYLVAIGRSPNTVRTYAYALAQYLRFLEGRRLGWREVRLEDMAAFVTWLRRPVDDDVVVSLKDRRSPNTINKTLAAVSAFYDYHVVNGCDVADQLTVWRDISGKRYKPFLHHVSKDRPVRSRVLKVRPTDRLPQLLQPDQVAAILAACRRRRDLFLFALLFETGMRIGQALGLRHEDMTTWDGTVRIVPRDDNVNGARAKTRSEHVVHVSPELSRLYSDYMHAEYGDLDSDYVFVNLWGQPRGRPMTYANVYRLVRQLRQATGVDFRPHQFRHTHATEMLRAGVRGEVARRRLTHTSTSSLDRYYTHLDDADLRSAAERFWAAREAEGPTQEQGY
jgi:integrase/recombinase XerD